MNSCSRVECSSIDLDARIQRLGEVENTGASTLGVAVEPVGRLDSGSVLSVCFLYRHMLAHIELTLVRRVTTAWISCSPNPAVVYD